jgi:hypothetical protein
MQPMLPAKKMQPMLPRGNDKELPTEMSAQARLQKKTRFVMFLVLQLFLRLHANNVFI